MLLTHEKQLANVLKTLLFVGGLLVAAPIALFIIIQIKPEFRDVMFLGFTRPVAVEVGSYSCNPPGGVCKVSDLEPVNMWKHFEVIEVMGGGAETFDSSWFLDEVEQRNLKNPVIRVYTEKGPILHFQTRMDIIAYHHGKEISVRTKGTRKFIQIPKENYKVDLIPQGFIGEIGHFAENDSGVLNSHDFYDNLDSTIAYVFLGILLCLWGASIWSLASHFRRFRHEIDLLSEDPEDIRSREYHLKMYRFFNTEALHADDQSWGSAQAYRASIHRNILESIYEEEPSGYATVPECIEARAIFKNRPRGIDKVLHEFAPKLFKVPPRTTYQVILPKKTLEASSFDEARFLAKSQPHGQIFALTEGTRYEIILPADMRTQAAAQNDSGRIYSISPHDHPPKLRLLKNPDKN